MTNNDVNFHNSQHHFVTKTQNSLRDYRINEILDIKSVTYLLLLIYFHEGFLYFVG